MSSHEPDRNVLGPVGGPGLVGSLAHKSRSLTHSQAQMLQYLSRVRKLSKTCRRWSAVDDDFSIDLQVSHLQDSLSGCEGFPEPWTLRLRMSWYPSSAWSIFSCRLRGPLPMLACVTDSACMVCSAPCTLGTGNNAPFHPAGEGSSACCSCCRSVQDWECFGHTPGGVREATVVGSATLTPKGTFSTIPAVLPVRGRFTRPDGTRYGGA